MIAVVNLYVAELREVLFGECQIAFDVRNRDFFVERVPGAPADGWFGGQCAGVIPLDFRRNRFQCLVPVSSGKNPEVFQLPCATRREGEFFGEMAVLFDRPRSATVRATRPCDLLVLDGGDFRRIIQDFPEADAEFRRLAAERQAARREA